MQRELAGIGITGPRALVGVGWNFVKTVWEPTQSDIAGGITALARGALAGAPTGFTERFARANPEVAALYAEGYDPPLPVEELAGYPAGSLGRAYAEFILSNGIDPLGPLLAIGAPTHPFHYAMRRAYKLHDLLHVVLGCDTSDLGEVRIVSWSIGQTKHMGVSTVRAPAMALSVLLLHLTLREPEKVAEAVELSGAWLDKGRRASDHLRFRFEDHLSASLDEVRALYAAA